jgi:hypothetical protein
LLTDIFGLFLRQQTDKTDKRQSSFSQLANGKRIKENRLGIPYIERTGAEYEDFVVLKIFTGPPRLRIKDDFLFVINEKPFRKDDIFRKIFINSRTLFWSIFLTK